MQKLINDLKNNVSAMTEYMIETEESDEVGKDMASPIEKVMYLSLTELYLNDIIGDPLRNYKMIIEPQPEVIIGKKKYRPDFKIYIHQIIQVADELLERSFECYIECDGHEYHERTKEQARKDRSKDRAFMSEGLNLLRFTGSEIYNAHNDCANEVINYMYKNMITKEFKEM